MISKIDSSRTITPALSKSFGPALLLPSAFIETAAYARWLKQGKNAMMIVFVKSTLNFSFIFRISVEVRSVCSRASFLPACHQSDAVHCSPASSRETRGCK